MEGGRKGQVGEQTSQVRRCLNKPLVQIGCLSFGGDFNIYFFTLLPSLHLGLEATLLLCVSKAVETNLHRKAVCISNSWDAGLTSSFIDLQGDACCADTLECMSPLPPSALCGHILNDYRRLWRECVFVHVYVCSAIV